MKLYKTPWNQPTPPEFAEFEAKNTAELDKLVASIYAAWKKHGCQAMDVHYEDGVGKRQTLHIPRGSRAAEPKINPDWENATHGVWFLALEPRPPGLEDLI
jgi:hypothetical protein